MASDPSTEAAIDRGPKYRRRLLQMLATATFFNGYDAFVLAFALPLILANLGGSEAQGGLIFLVVNLGEVVAFLLAAQADRLGRRRLLLFTIIAYTIATALTAAAPNLLTLTLAQFVARIFLGAEWAVAIAIVVEDFPSNERARGLAIVAAMLTLGGILVGVLAFVGLGNTPLQWRAFYLVGLVPLIVVAFLRRGMHETELYSAVRANKASSTLDHTSLREPWKPKYRGNLLAIGLMHFFRFTALSAAVAWWPTYAQREVGMSVSLSGIYLATAGLLGAVGFIFGSRLMDRWGRRASFLVYAPLTTAAAVALFQVHSAVIMLPLLCVAIFFGLGSGCMTSAFATEPFPTYVRSRAAAWARNDPSGTP